VVRSCRLTQERSPVSGVRQLALRPAVTIHCFQQKRRIRPALFLFPPFPKGLRNATLLRPHTAFALYGAHSVFSIDLHTYASSTAFAAESWPYWVGLL
jgi:hypothetical protein